MMENKKIHPYSQHYTAVRQFVRDAGAYKVYEYLFDKYLENYRKYGNVKAVFPMPGINKMKYETGVERRTVNNAIQSLKVMRLISEVDGDCIVHVGFCKNLIDAFLPLSKEDKKKFGDALKNGDIDTLKSLGLAENDGEVDDFLNISGSPEVNAPELCQTTQSCINRHTLVSNDTHLRQMIQPCINQHNLVSNDTTLYQMTQSCVNLHNFESISAGFSVSLMSNVRQNYSKSRFGQRFHNLLSVISADGSADSMVESIWKGDLDECYPLAFLLVMESESDGGEGLCHLIQSGCVNRHMVYKYINNPTLTLPLQDNKVLNGNNKLKQDNNTVTSFSFLTEEKEGNQEKERILENSRFQNGLDDADENSQVESEKKREREEWQKTDRDENFQSENQEAVNADNDDVDNGDDSDEEFHFQPLFGKVNTVLRDFNKEYREELKRKRASQGEREHRRTPEEAERQRQEEMKRGAEVLRAYSSQVFEDRKSPDMKEIDDMGIVIRRQQSQYPYFPSAEVKEFAEDMTCCLDRADKIYLNRMWDILGEYLAQGMRVDEEAGEKRPDWTNPEGGLVEADRLIPDILRPAYDETVEILERGTWTDKFGEEHPVTCGKEFQFEKIMLMVDWERKDGIERAYYKISSKTIHDTYAEKVPFIPPLFEGVKRGVMTEARRDCNFIRNLMRAGDDVNMRDKLTQIEYGIYLFLKKNCVFDKYYHFVFDECPKSVRRHEIVDIYNSLSEEEKEDFDYQDIFNALSDQSEVMEPFITVNNRMFSYRRVMQWNAMHEYESILDGEDHDSEVA